MKRFFKEILDELPSRKLEKLREAFAALKDTAYLQVRVIEGAHRAERALQAEAFNREGHIRHIETENDKLRALPANTNGPCIYCALPASEWEKCASGFPGCARGNDAVLCMNVGAALGLQDRIDELMWQYCPEQMTPEQIESYKRSRDNTIDVPLE